MGNLAGVALDKFQKLSQRFHLRLPAHRKHLRREVRQRHGREVLDGIERQILHQSLYRRHIGRSLQQYVAIGLGFSNQCHTERVRYAGPVINDYRFAHSRGEFLAQQARHNIARSTGRDRHNEPYALGG